MKIAPFVLVALCLLDFVGSTPMVRAQQEDSPLSSLTRRLTPKDSAATLSTTDKAATRFQPSGKRDSLDALLKEAAHSEEERKALRDFVTAIFDAYEEDARRLKMENDVAAALTFTVSVPYQVYSGIDKLDDAVTLAMYRQFQAALAGDMAKRSNAEKQHLYEQLVVSGCMSLLPLQVAEAQKDEAGKKKAREAAGNTLRTLLKAEPERVKLTAKGVEITGATANVSSGGTGNGAGVSLTGVPQLSYKTDGWEIQKNDTKESTVLTRKTKKGLLIAVIGLTPVATKPGTREEMFWGFWKEAVASNFQFSDYSADHLEIVCRRPLGNATGLFYHGKAKNPDNTLSPTSLYVIEAGKGFYYIMVRLQPQETGIAETLSQLAGNQRNDDANQAVEELLAGVHLTGEYTRKPLFTPSEVKGQWIKMVVASTANYVTTSGVYAGDASSGFTEDLNLNADGTFTMMTVVILKGKRGNTNTTEGKYRIEGDKLILSYLKTTGRQDIKSETRRILGVGVNHEGKKRLILAQVDEPLSLDGILYAMPHKPISEK